MSAFINLILCFVYFLNCLIVEPLTLSTPTHKPRSVSAFGRRRPSVSGSQSVHDFQHLQKDRNEGILKINVLKCSNNN